MLCPINFGSFVPIATERSAAKGQPYSITSSAAREQSWRHFETERFGGLQVDEKVELIRQHYG